MLLDNCLKKEDLISRIITMNSSEIMIISKIDLLIYGKGESLQWRMASHIESYSLCDNEAFE